METDPLLWGILPLCCLLELLLSSPCVLIGLWDWLTDERLEHVFLDKSGRWTTSWLLSGSGQQQIHVKCKKCPTKSGDYYLLQVPTSKASLKVPLTTTVVHGYNECLETTCKTCNREGSARLGGHLGSMYLKMGQQRTAATNDSCTGDYYFEANCIVYVPFTIESVLSCSCSLRLRSSFSLSILCILPLYSDNVWSTDSNMSLTVALKISFRDDSKNTFKSFDFAIICK